MAALTLYRDTMPERHRGQVQATGAIATGASATSSESAKVIHSGHFMISNPHRTDQDSSDEDESSFSTKTLADARESLLALQRPANRGKVDQSLTRLFQCLSLAYK